jgi:RNA polymerase sigma-70 factor, ECF subfamily
MIASTSLTRSGLMPDIDVLIQRWQSGDQHAAETLFNHFREQVYRLAYGLLSEPADAEEAAQDALSYALLNIRRFDPNRSSFTTWLHTITVSRCRNRYRRRRFASVSLFTWLEEGHDIVDPSATPEHLARRREIHGEVWEAIKELKPPLREAILLRYWAGHTYREIAAIVGCPVPTAQSRVRLAFDQLRIRLAPEDLTVLEEEQAL